MTLEFAARIVGLPSIERWTSDITVYERRPSETTMEIFKKMFEDMKADPMNRKTAEAMKHPTGSAVGSGPRTGRPKRTPLRRVK